MGNQVNSFSFTSPNALCILVLMLGLLLSGCAADETTEIRECGWEMGVFAWTDENGNGDFDEGEQGLSGVRIRADDVTNDEEDVGGDAVTDTEGYTLLDRFPAPC
ncbi:MAG: hypothetical protein GTO18_08155 [Anaerolineales bacterium]|nr:hypothetical protein [Anaerolineales bacterium]